MPRALVNRNTRGLIKLAAQAGTGRLLGVHAIAEGAGEAITAAVYALTAGADRRSARPHLAHLPDLAEEARFLRGAAG